MPFVFGATKTTQKLTNQDKKAESVVLIEHFDPTAERYFLFLTEHVLHKIYIDLLQKDIEKAGIKSYLVVSSIMVSNPKEDSTVTLLSLESDWIRYVTFDNKKCSCVVAFGSALRVLNKSADVNFYDFLDDTFNAPRYWCSSDFVNGPDCWVYPVAKTEDLYPVTLGNDYSNMYTAYFRDKLKRIQSDDMSATIDMRPYEIFEITED
jgi:hypothetical protein